MFNAVPFLRCIQALVLALSVVGAIINFRAELGPTKIGWNRSSRTSSYIAATANHSLDAPLASTRAQQAIYVVSLDGVPGAPAQNSGRLTSFYRDWQAGCGDRINFTLCRAFWDNRRGYGLTRTYATCLKQAYKDGADVAYFFEDDARLKSFHFCDEFYRAQIWADAPSSTLMVLLGGHHIKWGEMTRLGLQETKQSFGTYAFSVARDNLPILAKWYDDELNRAKARRVKMLSPDVSLYKLARRERKRVFVTNPLVVMHPGGYSNTWKQMRKAIDNVYTETAHLINRDKVFVVGLPRSGGDSFHNYFECGGFSSSRWKCGRRTCGECIKHNVMSRRDPIRGCNSEEGLGYAVYSQMDVTASPNDVCFYPQISSLHDLHVYYPNSTFLLGVRPVGNWVRSIQSFKSMHLRMQKCFNWTSQNISYDLEQFYINHNRFIKSFSHEHKHKLVVVNVEEQKSTALILSEIFKIRTKCWQSENFVPRTVKPPPDDFDQQLQQAMLVQEQAPTNHSPHNYILVVIPSGMKTFPNRSANIMQTWNSKSHPAVSVHFFFGEVPNRDAVYAMGEAAGIKQGCIHFLPVCDDEYPPVQKNTEMLRLASEMASEDGFKWVLKVDDDTYVSVKTLVSFVGMLPLNASILMGQRGYGRPKDRGWINAGKNGFCMGGPGYLLSASALAEVAPHFQSCVREDNNSGVAREYIWHSDVVIGSCVRKWSQLHCWEGRDIRKGLLKMPKYRASFFFQQFSNNRLSSHRFMTAHPMKTLSLMMEAYNADRV